MYKDDMDLSNYQFEDKDKTELDKLVTPTTPTNPMIAKIETYKNTHALKKNDPKTKTTIETEVNLLLTFVKNLQNGKNDKNKMIAMLRKLMIFIKHSMMMKHKVKQPFENSIKAF